MLVHRKGKLQGFSLQINMAYHHMCCLNRICLKSKDLQKFIRSVLARVEPNGPGRAVTLPKISIRVRLLSSVVKRAGDSMKEIPIPKVLPVSILQKVLLLSCERNWLKCLKEQKVLISSSMTVVVRVILWLLLIPVFIGTKVIYRDRTFCHSNCSGW